MTSRASPSSAFANRSTRQLPAGSRNGYGQHRTTAGEVTLYRPKSGNHREVRLPAAGNRGDPDRRP